MAELFVAGATGPIVLLGTRARRRSEPNDANASARRRSLVLNATDNVPSALRTQAIDALYNQVKLDMGNLEVEPFESPTGNVYAAANDDGIPTTSGAFNWIQSDSMMQKVVSPRRPASTTTGQVA